MEDMTPEEEAQRARYFEAAHAMQSGVAMMMNYDDRDTTKKHLRVGVNSALVDASSLAALLIDKGIITRLDYLTAVADGMEREVGIYEERVKDTIDPEGTSPTKITFH